MGATWFLRRPDAADIRPALEADDLLDDGVHIAGGGAHFVDDAAALVLDLPARGEICVFVKY